MSHNTHMTEELKGERYKEPKCFSVWCMYVHVVCGLLLLIVNGCIAGQSINVSRGLFPSRMVHRWSERECLTWEYFKRSKALMNSVFDVGGGRPWFHRRRVVCVLVCCVMLVYVSAMLLLYVMCVCVVVGNEPYTHGLSAIRLCLFQQECIHGS